MFNFPDSREIYREYLCLELHYVDKVSGQAKDEEPKKEGDELQAQIKEGKIAQIVLKKALEDIPEDHKFETELLALVINFPNLKVRSKIIDQYLEIRGDRPTSWDILARLQMLDTITDDGRSVADKVEQCCQIYSQGLEKIPTSQMFELYLTTLFELSRSVAKEESEKVFMTVKVLEAFDLAEKKGALSEEQKAVYQELVDGNESDTSD